MTLSPWESPSRGRSTAGFDVLAISVAVGSHQKASGILGTVLYVI